jgi:excinuclease ABC subunit A
MGPTDIVQALCALPQGSKVTLLSPVPKEELADPTRLLSDLQRQGFIRVRIDGEVFEIETPNGRKDLSHWKSSSTAL